jgi:hypothetical protein
MRKYLALGSLFLIVACSNSDSSHSNTAVSDVTDRSESNTAYKEKGKFYLRLIELIETASKNAEMSDELMRKIFSVYDEKLLSNSGPNSLNPFMECVKVHQDLLITVKNAPEKVVQNFRYLQDDFLRELSMLKECKIANEHPDCYTASRMLEGAYLKFLLFHFSQNKDYYEKCIADAIRKNSFSPAIAAALHLKMFGTSHQRLIEAPHVRFLRKNPGKILQLWLTGCCGTVHMEFLYVDERREIHKTSFSKQCENECVIVDGSPRIAILAAEGNKFCGWDENKGIIEFSTRCQRENGTGGIVYFKFDPKNMRWIEVEAKDKEIDGRRI